MERATFVTSLGVEKSKSMSLVSGALGIGVVDLTGTSMDPPEQALEDASGADVTVLSMDFRSSDLYLLIAASAGLVDKFRLSEVPGVPDVLEEVGKVGLDDTKASDRDVST